MSALLDELRHITGAAHVFTDGDLSAFTQDWRRRAHGKALAAPGGEIQVQLLQNGVEEGSGGGSHENAVEQIGGHPGRFPPCAGAVGACACHGKCVQCTQQLLYPPWLLSFMNN